MKLFKYTSQYNSISGKGESKVSDRNQKDINERGGLYRVRKIQTKLEPRGWYCIKGDKGDKIMVRKHDMQGTG